MVKRLPQAEFEAAKFDSGGFNLHQRAAKDGPPGTLVVLVHGLGGRGYRSWRKLPGRLFDSADGPSVDVAVFDYKSLLRGIARRADKFEFWGKQLAEHLREVEAEYSDIFLVGHSLGGLIIEAVAKNYLANRALKQQEGPSSLAALVMVASPRAGSGWALPVFPFFLSELRFLRRFSTQSADVDEFFSTYVERHNITQARRPRVVLPVYGAIGGGDKLVKRFSATFGIPTHQRLHLNAGHKDIAKDPQLSYWLGTVIAERLEVRKQAAREQQFATSRSSAAVADGRFRVVTRLLTDPSGLPWAELYNKARLDATSTSVVVEDERDAPAADMIC